MHKWLSRWMHTSQYSAEAWVLQALERHPWRVNSERQADVNFITLNLTLLTESGVQGGLVTLRKALEQIYKAGNLTNPPAIVRTTLERRSR